MKHFSVMLALAYSLCCFAVPKKLEPCGTVVTANGVTTVKAKTLAVGGFVFPGDEVTTSNDASIKLLMVDKSIIDLGPNTSFTIEDYRDGVDATRQVDVALAYGTLRASVTKKLDEKSKFQVRTKSSVLAVRGTEFLTKWEVRDGKVSEQVTVGSGRVEMNTGGRLVALNPGNQYNATGIANVKSEKISEQKSTTNTAVNEEKPVLKGEVTNLPIEKVKETLKEAKVVDKTFTDTVTLEKRTAETKKEDVKKTSSETAKTEAPKTVTQQKITSATSTAANSGTPPISADVANGTLGSFFQAVTGERVDGVAVVPTTAKVANPTANSNSATNENSARKIASEETVIPKADTEIEGPKIATGFANDPTRVPVYTPGNVGGTVSTGTAATNIPSTATQTINVTVKVNGL